MRSTKQFIKFVLGVSLVFSAMLACAPAVAFAETDGVIAWNDVDDDGAIDAGETTYGVGELDEALNAGGIVKMYADCVSGAIAIDDSVTVTLDLNGKKVTSSSSFNIVSVYGRFVLKDSSGTGDGGLVSNALQGVSVNYGGTAVVEGGSITAWDCGVYVALGGNAVINGGSIAASDKGIQVNGGNAVINGGSIASDGYGIQVGSGGSAVIRGGDIDAGAYGYGVYALNGGSATVEGGEISGGRDGVYVGTDGTATVEGGEIYGAEYGVYVMSGGSAAIKGGKVSGYYCGVGVFSAGQDECLVSGGSFSHDPKPYLVEGCVATENAETGMWDVGISIASAEVSVAGEFTYDGSEHEPADITVTLNGKELTAGVDYVVSGYSENIEAGTASVSVSGKGRYSGFASGTFQISKATYDMSSAEWDYAGEFTYDGSEKTVVVVGLPAGVTVGSYSGNAASAPGDYVAKASLAVADANNYETPSIDDLAWAIESAWEPTESVEKTSGITADNVTPDDKADLEKAKVELEAALSDEDRNYSDQAKATIEEELERVNGALEALEDMSAGNVEQGDKDVIASTGDGAPATAAAAVALIAFIVAFFAFRRLTRAL